jgi:hypothetical protein
METEMIRTPLRAASLCIIAAIVASSPAIARKAMSMVDEADLATFADHLNILPFSTLPEKGTHDIALEVSPNIDKRVISGGRICSGFYRPKTVIAPLAERIVANWDVDGNLKTIAPNAPRATLRINNAVSLQRCALLNEYDFSCYVTTRLNGEIETLGTDQQRLVTPIESETVREVDQGIICSDIGELPRGPSQAAIWGLLNRGDAGAIAVLNREAIVKFVNLAQRKIDQNSSAKK